MSDEWGIQSPITGWNVEATSCVWRGTESGIFLNESRRGYQEVNQWKCQVWWQTGDSLGGKCLIKNSHICPQETGAQMFAGGKASGVEGWEGET